MTDSNVERGEAPLDRDRSNGSGNGSGNGSSNGRNGRDNDNGNDGQSDAASDAMPVPVEQMLPTVGIGGSAGSIPALQTFLSTVAPDSGMAFVVIVHLAPEHESGLAALLQHSTRMRVIQVTRAEKIEPNRVYVIPPAHALRMVDGHLTLAELTHGRGRHVAVDLFFRSLADGYGPRAAAIVLSGADGDGASGIKRIRECGGLTIAQDPDEAEFAGMPRAAIATGMVDWVLPVAKMPERVTGYRRLEQHLVLPPEEDPQPVELRRSADEANEAALRDVLSFLRARTGRDFSYYKRATTLRRIARRMQVNGIDTLSGYLDFLRTHPAEAGALLQDLLISVTNFFRDSDSYAALQLQIPALFGGKGAGDRVRVWIAACATGEEAYSIAMLLAEYASSLEAPPQIQVFATDLDEQAIQTARSGLYPAGIEVDVSPERLRRFFVKEHKGYCVRRELRETVLFALHDLLKNSPFSRLDLVSCRNLLIYLTRDAQTQLLETFHFALRPDAKLFLGSSETVDDDSPLFTAVDKRHRIYVRRPGARIPLPLPIDRGALAQALSRSARLRANDPDGTTVGAALEPLPGPIPQLADAGATSWPQFHFQLIEQLAPPSLVIDAAHDIVHLSENAGQFLQWSGGEPTKKLLRLVHPSLRIELRAAILQAAQTGTPVETPRSPVEIGGEMREVSILVSPASARSPDFFLVVFDSHPRAEASRAPAVDAPAAHPDPVAEQLDREIARLQRRLRDTVERYEASNEELKASNEELQAMNEELRTATEELETGREELQSINEELSTVNHELKSKVDELGSANSDMQNLMEATAIPTVFVDRELRITRYTPAAVGVFNLIPTDMGRPLTDLRTELDFATLGADALRVQETLVPIEREISRAGEQWFLARLLPYRTVENRIAGVVLTLVDISQRRNTETALRTSEERMRLIVENAREYAIFSLATDRRITSWNSGAERLLGYAEAEALGQPLDLIFTAEDRAADVPAREVEAALATGRGGDDRFQQRKDGSLFWASGATMSMRDAAGTVVGLVKILRDETEARRDQQALERSRGELLQAWYENEQARRDAELQKEHLASLFTQAPAPICILRGPEYRIEFANAQMCRLWGRPAKEVVGKPLFDTVPSVDGIVGRELIDGVMKSGSAHIGKAVRGRLDRHGDGSFEEVYLNFTYAPLRDVDGRIDGVLAMASDVTDELRSRERLSELHETEQAAGRAKDDFLAMLGHELRNPLAPLRTSLHLMRQQQAPQPGAAALLGIAERQAGNLARIVDDLLEASRISEGKIDLRLERIDLVTTMNHALDATRAFLESQQHAVAVSLPRQPLYMNADPVRVEQIVVNLLNNAGKYTPAGGRIAVSVSRAGEIAELRIADNGIGIADDLRPRLFQLFQQGNRELSREEGGLGVGLNVVRRLVELHGGTVEALSDGAGKGSEFVVRLPLGGIDVDADVDAHANAGRSAGADVDAAAGASSGAGAGADVDAHAAAHAGADARAAAATASALSAGAATDAAVVAQPEAAVAPEAAASALRRVLVVDDNRDAGETLVMVIESLGHETRLAADGPSALERVDEWQPDIVFLDIGLPGMDGYAVACEIRRRHDGPLPRLIAVTGYGQERDRAKTREAGFDEHLVKPAGFKDIMAILQAPGPAPKAVLP